MPHWLLSSLLNRGSARERLLAIPARGSRTRVGQSMYVSVRVPNKELSDRIGKAVNRRCTGGCRRGLAAQIRRGQGAVTVPALVGQACGVGIGPAPGHGTLVPSPIFVHRKRMMGPETSALPTWIWACCTLVSPA